MQVFCSMGYNIVMQLQSYVYSYSYYKSLLKQVASKLMIREALSLYLAILHAKN